MLDGHGDDLYRYKHEIRANFSSNIYGGIDNTSLIRHLAYRLPELVNSYPEPEPYTAEKILAREMAVEQSEVLVTAGATDAIYSVAQLLAPRAAAICIPTFSEYADACRVALSPFAEVSSLEDAVSYPTVWLCNPNNPDGRILERKELLAKVDLHPETTFVIDVSYAAFALHKSLEPKDAVQRENLILVGSLTKQYKVPGLRLGYVAASEALIKEMRKRRMPWAVNAPALEALCYLLTKHGLDYLPINKQQLHEEAEMLRGALRARGFEVYPSEMHYFLCRLPKDCIFTSAEFKKKLAEEHGLLVRNADNFAGLTNRHIRIASQGAESNAWLLSAIDTLLSISTH